MTTQELIQQAGLKPLNQFEHRAVDGVFISDTLTDVMAGAKSGDLWITAQTNKAIIPAANLVSVSAVVITDGHEVPAETIELASKYKIPILSSTLPTVELAGKLSTLGLKV